MKSVVSLDMSFHEFLLSMIMPLWGSEFREGIWIGNDGNLPLAGIGQKCPTLFTTLEEESDVEFALEIHGKKENWSLSMFVLFCWCGRNIEWFLETTNQLLSSSWQSFLSLFDTLLSLFSVHVILELFAQTFIECLPVVHTALGVMGSKYRYIKRKKYGWYFKKDINLPTLPKTNNVVYPTTQLSKAFEHAYEEWN